jgi:hypothetical protein
MSSVDQAVIDLVESVSIWGVLGLEVDSYVHEVRIFDRNLPACGKVDQSEAIFICTFMQAVLAYRCLMYGFLANFCVVMALSLSDYRLSIFISFTLRFLYGVYPEFIGNFSQGRTKKISCEFAKGFILYGC